ncbi:indole-3-glycerol phosphate synthase TrpC [Lysinibacillus agricola]|uniref:Indole-3-glycerol phosphate synthase n=1 Tax=Lysinibacillus agricola TaxID=2590012 RepID=A0ABX7AQL3_9BACI|nr:MULTISPECIES: indole-3-glycerol phosphate synthase TrpC [Lysinibacillus]KOS60949.1 indole-3-glycerol phosphate synthase [Lysinibacillus sp. FJAT-14222]QQP11495.1 indole-3-glycerol phosphate synthase TrpC [Lysinibacillus agricola]
MNILNKILEQKKLEVGALLERPDPLANFTEKLRPSLFERLRKAETLQVISEMKRASPSKGLIAEGADPVAQAKIYAEAGAAAISVLTDKEFFKGSFDDLAAVANAVQTPLLCKDFMIDRVQIRFAKASGASIILLIVAALTDEALRDLYSYATSLNLEVLVEVHDLEELERAIAVGAKLIGVNNRDLRTFEVSLERTREIAQAFQFEEEKVLISESGIWTQKDAKAVAAMGASGVLVGESLMRSGDAGTALKSLQVNKVGAFV